MLFYVILSHLLILVSVTGEIISLSGLMFAVTFMFAVTCQSEKRLSGVEWNSVSDKAERQSGQRLRISHAKVPHRFSYTFLLVLYGGDRKGAQLILLFSERTCYVSTGLLHSTYSLFACDLGQRFFTS